MSSRTVEHLDSQQAELLRRLRAARGGTVSFDELRAIGIENPAVVCYELEAAGLSIDRVPGHTAATALPVGVRLDERRLSGGGEDEPIQSAPAVADAALGAIDVMLEIVARAFHRMPGAVARTANRAARLAARSQALPDRALGLGLASLLGVLVAALIALALSGGAGSGTSTTYAHTTTRERSASLGVDHGSRVSDHHAASALAPAATAKTTQPPLPESTHLSASTETAATTATAPAPPQSQPSTSTSTSGAHEPSTGGNPAPATAAAAGDPMQIQAEGHQLLGERRYPEAIERLHAAMDASGQSTAACTTASSEACLAYAYALYDLGRALLLSGNPTAAIPILSKRLRIDNQQSVVQEELAHAERETRSPKTRAKKALRRLDAGNRRRRARGSARRSAS